MFFMKSLMNIFYLNEHLLVFFVMVFDTFVLRCFTFPDPDNLPQLIHKLFPYPTKPKSSKTFLIHKSNNMSSFISRRYIMIAL